MSFLRDLVFRKKDINEYPPNVVVEVKSEDYKAHIPLERNDCLLLYQLQESQLYELVLQKAISHRGLLTDYRCLLFSYASYRLH